MIFQFEYSLHLINCLVKIKNEFQSNSSTYLRSSVSSEDSSNTLRYNYFRTYRIQAYEF